MNIGRTSSGVLDAGRFAVRRGVARAYTLIEILIVVTLLGIASALVVPNVGSTDVLRVQSSVRAIVSDINFAQSDALARQQGRAVVFDTVANTYSVIEVRGVTLDPVNDTIVKVDLKNAHKFHDSKIESATFDGGNTLVFDEMGGTVAGPNSTTPSSGGTIIITGSGARFKITVEAYTGRVTVARI